MKEKTGQEIYRDRLLTRAQNRAEKSPYSEVLEVFLIHLRAMGMTPATVSAYIAYIDVFLQNIGKPVSQLKENDFLRYFITLDTYTPSYREAVKAATQLFSKFLVKEGLIDSPIVDTETVRVKQTPKQSTLDKRAVGYLTPEEVKKLLHNIKHSDKPLCWKSRDYAICVLFLSTGMRVSELYKLDVEDIRFDESEVAVSAKGGKDRLLPLTDQAKYALQEWLYHRSSFLKGQSQRALFVSNRGNRMSLQAINFMLTSYSEELNKGLRKMSPHKLRATFGTTLYNETKDLMFVCKAMHHSSTDTTALYIRDSRKDQDEKVKNIMARAMV